MASVIPEQARAQLTGRLAIKGGEKVRRAPVGVWPQLRLDVTDAVTPVAGSCRPQDLLVDNSEAKDAFERAFARHCAVGYAIAVSSGSIALDLATEALIRDRPGRILSCVYGHPASIRMACKLRDVEYVDMDPDTLCLSLAALERALSRGPVAAVIVTHVAGCIRDMPELAELCRDRAVPLIEDASHAHGSVVMGTAAGAFGTVGCFSLHRTKNLPAGEGGVLVTDNKKLYDELWRMHDLGRPRGASPYAFAELGSNHRMHPAACLLALRGLAALADQEEKRCKVVRQLASLLTCDDALALLSCDQKPRESARSYHALPLIYRPDRTGYLNRRRFAAALAAEGIPCTEGWTFLLPEIPGAAATLDKSAFPMADARRRELIWIEHRLLLEENAAQDITNACRKIMSLAATINRNSPAGSA